MSDHYSRKQALLTSTVILFIFAALGAASYSGGSIPGMFNALVAYRFLLGIGIGYVTLMSQYCLHPNWATVENIRLVVLHALKALEN